MSEVENGGEVAVVEDLGLFEPQETQEPAKPKGKKAQVVAETKTPEVEEEKQASNDDFLPEIEYPSLVYICPGAHQAHGATYDCIQVTNDEQLKQRLNQGYSVTLPEAIKRFKPSL